MGGGRLQNAGLDLTPPHPRLLLLGIPLFWGFTRHLKPQVHGVSHPFETRQWYILMGWGIGTYYKLPCLGMNTTSPILFANSYTS